jgi:Fe(3+) dicitrate transport protein
MNRSSAVFIAACLAPLTICVPRSMCQESGSPASPPATRPASGETVLEEVTVYGESEEEGKVQKQFLPAVEGVRIFAGKRATVIDLDALPKVQANNYRQALALTPGLLYSEETTPLVSLGYRGIGDPHRSQFIQVLKDGIPIHADPFGYPEAYYTPPLDVVDRIEFIRGGAALMYGTQPGGALNYVTNMPATDDPLAFRTQNIFGSDNLFSSYTAVDGTSGKIGYLGYYNHRESDGFRHANSDYTLDGAHGKLVFNVSDKTRWILALDFYEEEHGEPGGLTAAQYAADRNQTTRPNDRFEMTRNAASLELQHEFQPGFDLNVKTWGGYYDRYSKRQIIGTNTNNIEQQEFYTFGIEPRLRYDWTGWGAENTFTGGVHFYTLDSPRSDKRGATATASDGVLRRYSQRDVNYFSVFAENKFTYDRFSVTPGVRMEFLDQDVTTTNLAAPLGIFSKENSAVEPLFGIGFDYDLENDTDLYANISQGYRGAIFTESVIPAPGATIEGDIDPSTSWTYELGWRGTPQDWLTFDTSVFLVDLDNRFGVINNTLQSVGRSLNFGWDLAVQADLIGAWDEAHGTRLADTWGSLSFYTSLTLLDAELHGGPNDGGTPQYAPDYLLRSGLIWTKDDRVKLSMLGTFLDDHNAQDSGAAAFAIPAYMTWDLTAEVKVTDNFTVMAGINNLFNEDYYARVRSDGIDPAYERNFYLGGSLSF